MGMLRRVPNPKRMRVSNHITGANPAMHIAESISLVFSSKEPIFPNHKPIRAKNEAKT